MNTHTQWREPALSTHISNLVVGMKVLDETGAVGVITSLTGPDRINPINVLFGTIVREYTSDGYFSTNYSNRFITMIDPLFIITY
jgi:hypothetical protein